jgi:hypothetical protein
MSPQEYQTLLRPYLQRQLQARRKQQIRFAGFVAPFAFIIAVLIVTICVAMYRP